jgi:uncharacterized membrane protein YcaP (DUF421 family)
LWVFPIRATLIYLGLLLATRISGRREVATLDPYSFVVAITVGSLASPPMVDAKSSVLIVLTAIFAFYSLHIIMWWLEGRFPVFAKLVGDEPLVLVENGKLVEDNMMDAHYNLDNLMSKLRYKGAPDIQDVEFAVLEPSGELSVLKKSQSRPVTKGDMNIQSPGTGWPRVVVADGVVNHENLDMTGHNEAWVFDQIKAKGIDDIQKVMLMVVDREDNVYVDYIRPSQITITQ